MKRKRTVGGEHNDVYPTPDWLWAPLNRLLRFDLDAAADAKNAKCRRFYSERENGLVQRWNARSAWCNPPYGRRDSQTGEWVFKARAEILDRDCGRATLLIPVKAETVWYSRGVWGQNQVLESRRIDAGRIRGRWYRLQEDAFVTELLELEGRISFAAGANGWFASAVVIFNAGPRPVLPAVETFAQRRSQ